MALYKCVNGENVLMSAAEEASVRAEWAANAVATPPARKISDGELALLLISKGLIKASDLPT